MKASPRRVLALWRNNPHWRASQKDVRDALGGGKARSARLQSLLNDLVDQGRLVYERQRYRLSLSAPAHREKPAKSGDALTGVFSAHPDGYGFVAVEQLGRSVFVPPRKIGGALDGDTVALRMEPRKDTQRTSGKITEVVMRKRTTLRGMVHQERGEQWLLPLNEKLPMVFLEPGASSVAFARGDLVEAEFTSYPPDSRTAPAGRVVRVLADADSPLQIIDNILADLAILTDFSQAARREMEALAGLPAEPAGEAREDLTGLPFVTIDGADARDFDDAVCLVAGTTGRRRLLVAIADVAEYVRPGSAVDRDAYARGTSVYFPERVVPMLPEELSNDLCSLKEGLPRPTLVCEMTLDAAGDTKDFRIFEAVIRSKARLTYEQVQRFFDGGKVTTLKKAAPLAPMLTEMLHLSRLLAEKRNARGALAFEFPEASFTFSAPGVPDKIDQSFATPATRLIEQFMLEANETVAWHCETTGIPILYRAHDPPPPDAMADLRVQLLNFGLTLTEQEFRRPGGINRLLALAESHPAKEEIGLAILKSMSQAQYRARNDGHFGLGATHYTHFTSPIRRYPDLLVHRALKQSLAGGKPAKPPPENSGLHLSTCERTAAEAESRVKRLYRVLYMERFVGEHFAGTVSGLNARGLWVTLKSHFVDGLLPLTMLPDDHYRFDPRRNVVRAARGKRQIALAQRLTVQLVRAERLTQQLEFGFVAWDWEEEPERKARP